MTINYSSLNEEDKKIWDVLERFDFDSEPDVRALRFRLFQEILAKIGYCRNCTAFVKSRNFCNVLKVSTGPDERCSDFEPKEVETKPAFEIMNFEHEEAERLKMVEPNLLKYRRRKSKEINLGGDFK